jgi:hypothetical protein
MMESASHTVMASSEANGSTSTLHSVGNHTDSTELLRQLSDVVDGFARLSTPQKLTVNTSNGSGWSLLDHAHKLLSVTGACRETPERALTQ